MPSITQMPVLSQLINFGCLYIYLSISILVAWRFVRLDIEDQYKCQALLSKGQWLDAMDGIRNGQSYQNWQPPGCMMHDYNADDISQCLQGKQITLIGDSTMRQIYWAMTRKIDRKRSYEDQHTTKKHSDSLFRVDAASAVNFVWSPFLNSSVIQAQLMSTATAKMSKAMTSANAILAIGGGLWHARFLQDKAMPEWNRALSNITHLLGDNMIEPSQAGHTLNILTPVQTPLYDALSPERRRTINPSTIEAMNAHLLSISGQKGLLVPWSFARMAHEQPNAYDVSGLHVKETIAERMADIILNLKCNEFLSSSKTYPMDMTCCSRYAPTRSLQTIALMACAGVPLAWVCICFAQALGLRTAASARSRSLFRATSVLALSLGYCYLADRTQLWNKAQKQYANEDFQILCGLSLIIGIMTIRRSTRPRTEMSTGTGQPVLSRDQTDEWKGWMQILILIYHYTGASKVLPIYEAIRLLVASYLFLTGFGHTVFYLRKTDYSLKRAASVLIRMNLLSVLLPYVMKTEYLFYYFAPLTSFWFGVIYLTMRFQHQENGRPMFILCKLAVSALLVQCLIRIPLIFELIFNTLKYVCNIHWNVHEWRFRLQLDSLIVYVGMLCGLMFVHLSKAIEANKQGNFNAFDFIASNLRPIRYLLVMAAFITLWLFQTCASRAINKYTYNAYVPYTSLFPILAFVVLRNFHRGLRNYHSRAFAWVGRISLETFTLQFHIWLAADTKGLLRTGVIDRWYGIEIEFAVLTIAFLWVSKLASDATSVITNYVIDPLAFDESTWKSHAEKQSWEGKISTEGRIWGAKLSILRVGERISRDLRIRLCLILLALWMMNIVY